MNPNPDQILVSWIESGCPDCPDEIALMESAENLGFNINAAAATYYGNNNTILGAQSNRKRFPSRSQNRSSASAPKDGRFIAKGMAGDDVTKLQENLSSLGYNLESDGVFGDKTDRAFRQFQKDKGIVTDGVYGRESEIAMRNREMRR